MPHRIETASQPPDRDEFDRLLHEYYRRIFEDLEAHGVTLSFGIEDAIADFWQNVAAFLPPEGMLCLARGADGRLLGCGTLRRVGPETGELKRLYVRPEARGTGLGRALVQARLDAAARLGFRRLVVDTVRTTHAMQKIYRDLGFVEVPRFPESSTANAFPEVVPALLFFEKRLAPG
jgi:putative acetyltransferase